MHNESNVEFPYLSPKQIQLLNWFRLNATPLADAYYGAIQLLHDRHHHGRVHFIAHAVRDIADRLVFVLDPQLEGNRVQYEATLDKIMNKWPNLNKITNNDNKDFQHNLVTIDYDLAIMIDSLVKDHQKRRKRPSNYELLFRHLMRNEPSQGVVNERVIADFKKMRKWFMDRTHLRTKEAPQIEESELKTQFNKFEGMLYSFVGDFFAGTQELDEILYQANQ